MSRRLEREHGNEGAHSQEIKRTAEANGGKSLGIKGFESETGIKISDWKGRYWVRWSDAVREAGYPPNQLSRPDDIAAVLDRYAGLVHELGHIPVDAELLLKRRSDCTFPAKNAFRRFGTKLNLLNTLPSIAEVMPLMTTWFSFAKSICLRPRKNRPTSPNVGKKRSALSTSSNRVGSIRLAGAMPRPQRIRACDTASRKSQENSRHPNG